MSLLGPPHHARLHGVLAAWFVGNIPAGTKVEGAAHNHDLIQAGCREEGTSRRNKLFAPREGPSFVPTLSVAARMIAHCQGMPHSRPPGWPDGVVAVIVPASAPRRPHVALASPCSVDVGVRAMVKSWHHSTTLCCSPSACEWPVVVVALAKPCSPPLRE